MENATALADAGLRLERENKLNPRLLIRGVPCGLSPEEIQANIVALNLKDQDINKVKVIYLFPPREKRKTTNCVIEVSPDIRNLLMRENHIFIGYSSCKFSDHVRVLQCYKCLAFGHFAKDCKSSPLCGHCAGRHELRDCDRRAEAAVCGNCRKWSPNEQSTHSAMDSYGCPLLRRKLTEKAKFINYG